jgi:predicted nucleic acid-binding protein
VAPPTHLVDNSVLARIAKPEVSERLVPLIDAGLVATCGVTDLEQLFSSRSAREHREWREDIELRYIRIPIEQTAFDRAIEVQGLLADRGAHRAASIPDLIVAAIGELAWMPILHYDADFDLIAEVTGQPVEWVVPRGSID